MAAAAPTGAARGLSIGRILVLPEELCQSLSARERGDGCTSSVSLSAAALHVRLSFCRGAVRTPTAEVPAAVTLPVQMSTQH